MLELLFITSVSVDVENSVFRGFTSRVINYENAAVDLNVNFCVFSGCTDNSGDGGAILAKGTSVIAVSVKKVCAYGCSNSVGYGQFCFISIKSTGSNVCEMVTVTRSSPIASYGFTSPICNYNGVQRLNNINVSFCFPTHWSGLGLGYSTDSLFQYSSIASTHAAGWVCMLYSYQGDFSTQNVNFINNSQDSADYGIITETLNTKTKILQSIFNENTNSKNRMLFYSLSSLMTVNNCYIQSGTTSYRVSTPNNYGPTSEVKYSYHFSHVCHKQTGISTHSERVKPILGPLLTALIISR